MTVTFRVARTDTIQPLDSLDSPGTASALELLTGAERDRLHRLQRPQDRADFVAARVLVRELLTAFTGTRDVAWQIAQRCATCGGPHGRPYLSGADAGGLHLSWAHSHGLVAAAVADSPVGIDVERTRGDPPLSADGAPTLERWLRWTRAEALVKFGLVDLDTALEIPLSGPPGQSPAVAGAALRDEVAADGSWVASLAMAAISGEVRSSGVPGSS